MRKLRIIVPILLVVVAVTTISFSIVLAQGNEKHDSDINKLAVRVANILDLDATVVNDAIKKAHIELRDELAQEKLNALVSKGEITQERANEFLKKIQSKPHVNPNMGGRFFAPKGYNRHGKAKKHFPGAKSQFGAKDSEEAIQRKIRAAIENGEITREEAAAKYEEIEKLKARKAGKDVKFSKEDIGRKLRTLVKNGEITREEAAAKYEEVEKLKARKSGKDK